MNLLYHAEASFLLNLGILHPEFSIDAEFTAGMPYLDDGNDGQRQTADTAEEGDLCCVRHILKGACSACGVVKDLIDGITGMRTHRVGWDNSCSFHPPYMIFYPRAILNVL